MAIHFPAADCVRRVARREGERIGRCQLRLALALLSRHLGRGALTETGQRHRGVNQAAGRQSRGMVLVKSSCGSIPGPASAGGEFTRRRRDSIRSHPGREANRGNGGRPRIADEQLLDRRGLEQIGLGAGSAHLLGHRGLLEHRQRDDPRLRQTPLDTARGLLAAHHRHGHIHHDDIRLQLARPYRPPRARWPPGPRCRCPARRRAGPPGLRARPCGRPREARAGSDRPDLVRMPLDGRLRLARRLCRRRFHHRRQDASR